MWNILATTIRVSKQQGHFCFHPPFFGVCGSDYHIFKGENPCSSYPLVPGHENVGIITKIGEGVTTVKVGDHVVVDLIITCGRCYQCTHGRENVCETVLVRGSGTDGGWREYFTAPQDDVYVIDPKIPWKDAALIEPFAIGGHCCRRGRVAQEDTVLILGTGTIGSIILQTCKMIGAKVICADINDETLQRAEKYGAGLVVNTKKENLVEKVQVFTEGHCCTVAFDSACFPGSLTSLFEDGLIGNAGRIISLGFCTEPEAISQAMLDKREIDLIGSRMSAYQFAPTAKNMAEGLLENGCKVVLMDVQKEKLDAVVAEYRDKGYEAFGVCGNLADRAGIDRMFDKAMQHLGGKLDVLIPAAGIQRRHLPEEFPIDEWDLVMRINLDHVFIMTQKALGVMLNQPTGGKIINIASMVSWFGGTTVPAYTASKGAITQLTKSLAVDCAGRGININALAPGYMDTEMCANMAQSRKEETTVRIPQGRWGTPDDMKGPVLFLASAASDYLNGAVIPVDGAYLCK